MELRNLDEHTRAAMLAELECDIASDALYVSSRLSPQGVADYPDLLRIAAREGDGASLAADLASGGRLRTHETAKHPKGGLDIVRKVPVTAAQTMADGEFGRFYARGVCVRAVDVNGPEATVTIYRARESARPRPESVALVGKSFSASSLLEDLRTHIGVDTALRLPPGPNSGLSVHL